MSRILITGGNGFVGNFLVEYLASFGNEISLAVRDDRNNGRACSSFSVGNIDGSTNWSQALANQDVVIHLANIAHVPLGENNGSMNELRKVNVDGSVALAEAAISCGIKRFIFLSSIKVNGEGTSGVPFCESDRANPQDLYAESKLEAEQRLKALCMPSSIELVILRPPLIYGPNVKGNLEVLKKMVAVGIPLPFLCVSNTRDMISLKNLSDLIRLCIDHPDAVGQTLLCSDGQPVSTPKLIRYIASAQGRRVLLFPIPVKVLFFVASLLGREEQFQRLAGDLRIDIASTKKKLNWTPSYAVDEAMKWAFSDDELF